MTAFPATAARLGFKPDQKLRTTRDFDRARKQGRRIGDALFGIHYAENPHGHARLGTAVAVRLAGNAVRRNLVRRLIRESFRLHQHELPAVDLFVSARTKVRTAANAEISASLDRLWKQVRL